MIEMHVIHKEYNHIVMNRAQLELFVQVAETGSFTRAGEKLNITQPAVSRSISALENELGVRLMIRDRRQGLMLTDIGSRLLVQSRVILKQFEQMEQLVAAEKGLEIGKIRIGSFPMTSTHLLPRVIRDIRERYPGIEFDLREGTVNDIREWLDQREIDVGLIIASEQGEFESIPLLEEEMQLVCRDDHALASETVLSIRQLEGVAFIICNGGYEVPIYDIFRRSKAGLNVSFTVHNVNACLNMVQEGLGVALLPTMLLAGLPAGLKAIMLEPKIYREVDLALPSFAEASSATKLFVETVQRLYGRSGRSGSNNVIQNGLM